jgi:glycerol-3-phosphate acyltransferase PlsY
MLLPSAFLVGSIPFGYLLASARGIDLRTVGSGNIGATNVSRALGMRWGLVAFALDVGKGLAPAIVATSTIEGADQIHALGAGAAAIFGHCLSPFLGFRGGKGVATGLGAVLGSSPVSGLLALAVFALMLAVSRIVSLSSLVAASSLVAIAAILREPLEVLTAYAVLTLFLVYRHIPNIRRLIAGTERRFDAGRGSAHATEGITDSKDKAIKNGSMSEHTSDPIEPEGPRLSNTGSGEPTNA